MKRLITLILFAILSLATQAQSPKDLMQQGNTAYQKGDYQRAIASYTAIIEGGNQSADLYYNLGNAYYRQNEFGQAVLNYERALRLMPNFRDARENLALAQSKTEDRIDPLPELFITRWARTVVSWFSPTGWRIALLILLALLGALTAVFLLSKDYGWRKSSLIGGSILCILITLCIVCAIASHVRHNRHNDAIVTSPMSVVKSSPEADGVDKLVLHEGTKVSLGEDLDNWQKIRLADGNTGWIESSDITII